MTFRLPCHKPGALAPRLPELAVVHHHLAHARKLQGEAAVVPGVPQQRVVRVLDGNVNLGPTAGLDQLECVAREQVGNIQHVLVAIGDVKDALGAYL